MKRQEFIDEAKRRGKDKEEIRAKFKALDDAGTFDDSPSRMKQPEASAAQPGNNHPSRIQSQNKAFLENVAAPTLIGNAFKAKAGTLADAYLGVPERTARVIGGVAGNAASDINDALGFGINLAGRGINALTGGYAGRGVQAVAQPISSMLANAENRIDQSAPGRAYSRAVQNPAFAADMQGVRGGVEGVNTFGGMGMGAPVAKAAGKQVATAGGKVAVAAGETAENAGKSIIASDAKIKDAIAKLAGNNPLEGVKKITNDIAKYGVESTTGGFAGIAKNAQKKITESMKQSEDAIANYAKANPTATVDIDKTFMTMADDFVKGTEKSIFTNEDKAAEMAYKIHAALEKRGLAGEQPITKLPEIKRTIDNGLNLFKKGSKGIELDPLPSKVGELSYLRIKNALEDAVPEVAESNKAVHELITVKTAMEAAQKLAGNRNKLGITDLALIFGGPSVAHGMGIPGGALAAGLPGVVLAGKKIAGDARGASVLIKTGRGLKSIGQMLNK